MTGLGAWPTVTTPRSGRTAGAAHREGRAHVPESAAHSFLLSHPSSSPPVPTLSSRGDLSHRLQGKRVKSGQGGGGALPRSWSLPLSPEHLLASLCAPETPSCRSPRHAGVLGPEEHLRTSSGQHSSEEPWQGHRFHRRNTRGPPIQSPEKALLPREFPTQLFTPARTARPPLCTGLPGAWLAPSA